MKSTISKIDVKHLRLIRENIENFMSECAKKFDIENKILLDIAPQDHEGAKSKFKKCKIYTLDINPNANATYTADICRDNSKIIPNNSFDFVVCTEVLEHTLNPFFAVQEMKRILKPDGYLLVSVPFDFLEFMDHCLIAGGSPNMGSKNYLKNLKLKYLN